MIRTSIQQIFEHLTPNTSLARLERFSMTVLGSPLYEYQSEGRTNHPYLHPREIDVEHDAILRLKALSSQSEVLKNVSKAAATAP